MLNELRAGDTRRAVSRTAASRAGGCGHGAARGGNSRGVVVCRHAADVSDCGYQQLGSPPNTASVVLHERDRAGGYLDLAARRHTFKAGFDWRWERLERRAAALARGPLRLQHPGKRPARRLDDTGASLASFLLGQVQTFSIDVQQKTIQERAHVAGVLRPGRVAAGRASHAHPGGALHAELSVHRDQRADGCVQSRHGAAGISGRKNPVRPLKKNNFGPRFGMVYRLGERTRVGAGYGLVWIEMAGITTPFTTPSFPFLQTVTRAALDTISPAFGWRMASR